VDDGIGVALQLLRLEQGVAGCGRRDDGCHAGTVP
jgi:hypothetical protein